MGGLDIGEYGVEGRGRDGTGTKKRIVGKKGSETQPGSLVEGRVREG